MNSKVYLTVLLVAAWLAVVLPSMAVFVYYVTLLKLINQQHKNANSDHLIVENKTVTCSVVV